MCVDQCLGVQAVHKVVLATLFTFLATYVCWLLGGAEGAKMMIMIITTTCWSILIDQLLTPVLQVD